jgi:hypothetical protein
VEASWKRQSMRLVAPFDTLVMQLIVSCRILFGKDIAYLEFEAPRLLQ